MLATTEKRKLKAHEDAIEACGRSFMEIGQHLAAIRDAKLYVETDGTFEAYCKRRWELTARRAYQYIEAFNSVVIIKSVDVKNFTHHPLQIESHARVLASLPDERTQVDVWVKSVETAPTDSEGNPKVTAAHLKKTADEYTGKAKPARAKPAVTIIDVKPVEKCAEPDVDEEPAAEPAQPNTIGEAKEAYDAFVERLTAGKPAHFIQIMREHSAEVWAAL